MAPSRSQTSEASNPSTGELPPFSLEAEQATLGSCLIDRDVIAVVSRILTADDFYLAANAAVYRTILKLWNERRPADLIAVADEMKSMPRIAGLTPLEFVGGESYVSELIVMTPTAVHANYYADIVKGYANRRRNLDLAQRIVSDAYDADLSEDDRIARAAEAVRAMPQAARETVSMTALMERWQDEPDGMREHGIPTGIGTYDRMTGGLRRGQLVVIGARTSVGKSALAGQMAYRIAKRKHPVSFISLEMSSEAVSRRMVGQVVSVNISRAANDDTYYEANLPAITEARAVLAELPVYFNPRFASELPKVLGDITRQHDQFATEVAFVDYLGQITNPAIKQNNRAIELGSITRALKMAALELGITVVLLAQLNRGIEDRGEGTMPRLSDLRDSGSTEQDADIVLLMHRPKQDESKRVFYIAKNREGATGRFDMEFVDYRTMFIEPGSRP